MKRIIFSFILVIAFLGAAEGISAAKYARLVAKGEKIAMKLCDHEKLPKVEENASIPAITQAVKASGACPPLNRRKMEALALFLKSGASGSHSHTGKEISVPHGAKCPVCGMFVSKYPKWAAEMVVDGKRYYFDGVKDMMKFYIFDGDFPYDRKKIEKMLVTDFYTLEAIPARKAWYVLGSKVYGPMGNELIPFKTKKEAEGFIADHGGDRIVRFDQITGKMVMALDGIEYED
ncbi:nitrous oxide reductase accessory protein NosL [Nitratifractor sp.]